MNSLRSCRAAILVGFAALIPTGCFKLDIDTVVKANGSGSTKVIVALPNGDNPSGNLGIGSDLLFADMKTNAEAAGATVLPYADDDYTGYEATFEFDNPDEFQTQLSESAGEDTSGYLSDASLFIDEDAATVSLVLEGDSSDLGNVDDAEVALRVTMPGKILDFTEEAYAELEGSNTVVWRPNLAESRTYYLTVVSEVSPFGQLSGILLPLVAGLALTSVAGVALILRRRRHPRRALERSARGAYEEAQRLQQGAYSGASRPEPWSDPQGLTVGGQAPVQPPASAGSSDAAEQATNQGPRSARYCPECGSGLTSATNYCTHCGASVKPGDRPSEPDAPDRDDGYTWKRLE